MEPWGDDIVESFSSRKRAVQRRPIGEESRTGGRIRQELTQSIDRQ